MSVFFHVNKVNKGKIISIEEVTEERLGQHGTSKGISKEKIQSITVQGWVSYDKNFTYEIEYLQEKGEVDRKFPVIVKEPKETIRNPVSGEYETVVIIEVGNEPFPKE